MSDVVRNADLVRGHARRRVPDRVPLRGLARRRGGATLLLFLFAYAFSWIQAYTGLVAGSAEAVNSIAFLWMFVATFVSSAFVSPENMPSWLQPIAEHNPVTIVTDASRALYNGRDPGNDPWIALAWAIGITVVFATLSVRKYRSTTSH